MAESVIAITEGSGKSLHTWQRSISSTNKEDQVVLTGEPVLATYSALASGISTATSASHLMMLMADGTNYCRLRRIFIEQVAAAGSSTLAQLQLFRVSTAGSGGSSISPRPYDSADTNPFAGTVQTLPSSKGTEGNQLWQRRLWMPNSIAAQPNSVEYLWRDGSKPIIWGVGTTDGIALKIVTGIASGTVDITVEFTVSSYL